MSDVLHEVHIAPCDLARFRPLLGDAPVDASLEVAARLREALGQNAIWNVNSTAVGGGVAEMLPSLLGYARGVGLDTRWAVIAGPPEFFRLTKRIHHGLHGSPGDGSPLDGKATRNLYEEVSRTNAVALSSHLRKGDVVLLHDPQTIGMAPYLCHLGVRVVWRCHIGQDERSVEGDRAWAFLMPYLEHANAYVFSREAYVPKTIDASRVFIVQPSIDVFSPKNQDLDDGQVQGILAHVGLIDLPGEFPAPTFTRADGSPGRVEHRADLVRLGRPPGVDTRLIVQVSRWDPLKDMVGVMRGFETLVGSSGADHAELVLAGPNVTAVADDPEGPAMFREVLETFFAMPHAVRDRIHLAMLPTHDIDENAAIVNALQRHATIVVQKSLQEGFGLTVTEAMWKARPVVATRIGGIQDQIEDGVNGILLDDPSDLDAFARALAELIGDPARARQLGDAAQARVRERFLGLRHLLDYGGLLQRLSA